MRRIHPAHAPPGARGHVDPIGEPVALQFAELSAHYPLAGSVYQWSKQTAGKAWAWNTGWMYLWAQVITVPAVALAWQVILPQINTRFQFIKNIMSSCRFNTFMPKGFLGFSDILFGQDGPDKAPEIVGLDMGKTAPLRIFLHDQPDGCIRERFRLWYGCTC